MMGMVIALSFYVIPIIIILRTLFKHFGATSGGLWGGYEPPSENIIASCATR